jgi:homoserine dehydrogenase
MTEYRRLRVALLGAGAVGSQVAALLLKHSAELADRAGASLELVGIAVRDLDAAREVDLPRELFTTDPEPLLVGADIVIELMGGIEPARTYLLQAINAGADVVTANKALLATHGPEIFEAADQVGAQVYYEAAAAGAIPIIRPLRDSLAGDRVQRIMGIVNGTTNYILDRMDVEGAEFSDVLAQAQVLGYAEADPTADVEGYDAAQKAAILASLAFHTTVPLETVHREGITAIDKNIIDAARHAGYVVKLLAVCERLLDDDGVESISVRVYPALVDRAHPLASVHGAHNAVFVQAEAAGNLMFYGAGAGGVQTASAVLGDVVSAARRHIAGGVGVAESTRANLPIVSIGHVTTRYQITLEVDDRPGVLATIAGILSDGRVSIATVEQTVIHPPTDPAGAGADPAAGSGSATATPPMARLVIGTHEAREQHLSETVTRLAESGVVERVVSVLRVEGD